MEVITLGVLMLTNCSKCTSHSTLQANCLLAPSPMSPLNFLKKVPTHWETLTKPSQFCKIYRYTHLYVPWYRITSCTCTAQHCGLVWPRDYNNMSCSACRWQVFICILKTKSHEELEFIIQPAVKRQLTSPCYFQKIPAYSTHCSDYLLAFFTWMQISSHLKTT